MRYLAIDYGTKRTGLAICDQTEKIASPLAVIQTKQDPIKKIAEIIKEENVEAIVIGLPINMDNSQGPQAKLTLTFADNLKKHIDIPIHLHDERLSTFAAEEKLAPAELNRSQTKKRIDAVAAAHILQSFLDQKN